MAKHTTWRSISLIFILVLISSLLSAQTTYQLNYDSIRVNKTAGTGGTSLYGKVYLKNASEGTGSDSVLTIRNGRIYKIAKSALVDTTKFVPYTGADKDLVSSFSVKADSLSGNGDLITNVVHLNGTETITGSKTFSSILTQSTPSAGTGVYGSTFESTGIGSYGTRVSGANFGSTDPAFSVYDRSNALMGFKVDGSGNVTIATSLKVSALTSGLVKSTSGTFGIATPGTDYLTPTGSGSGLSGVVLTTTNQTGLAGDKTWTGTHTFSSTISLPITTSTSGYITQDANAGFGIRPIFHTYSSNASYSKNIFAGYEAGNFTMTSSAIENTGYGSSTLRSLTSGIGNVAIGFATGNQLTTGSYNIFIGKGSGGGITTGNFNTIIGYNSLVTHSSSLTNTVIIYGGNAQRYVIDSLGNHDFKTGAATFSSSVTATTLTLSSNSNLITGSAVTGTNRVSGVFSNTSGNLAWGVNGSSVNDLFNGSSSYQTLIGTSTANDFGLATNNQVRLNIYSGGNVKLTGFNGAAAYGLILNSTSDTGTQYMMEFTRQGNQAGYIASASSTTVGIFNTSDYRTKKDYQDFSGTDKLNAVNFYDFEWIGGGSRDYGVIAHELQAVLPMAVLGEKDGERMQAVDYVKLIPIIGKAGKESIKRIENLEAENEELKRRLTELESKTN